MPSPRRFAGLGRSGTASFTVQAASGAFRFETAQPAPQTDDLHVLERFGQPKVPEWMIDRQAAFEVGCKPG
jgi:hypothetical protein